MGNVLRVDEAGRKTNVESHLCHVFIWIFVLSFALDVKGQVGGSPIQYGMAAVNVLAFLLIFIQHKMTLPKNGLVAFVVFVWLTFIIVGSAGALLNDVPFGHYLRIVYQFFLMIEGMLVVWWTVKEPRTATMFVSAMTVAAVISLIYTFTWELYFTRLTAGNLRYTIVSPLEPLLMTICGYDLIFARRNKLFSIIVLSATFVVVYLSLTRGMLLPLLLPIAALFIAWAFNVKRGRLTVPGPVLRTLIVGVVFIACFLSVMAIVSPTILEQWFIRATGPGSTSSLWTRVAAIVGQFDQITVSDFSWLAGMGFGHAYTYPTAYADFIGPFISSESYRMNYWFPGEFMWVTPIYYSGFLAGGVAVLALLLGAKRAFDLLAWLLYKHAWRKAVARPVWIGALGYLAFLGMGFTQNPFMDRLSALFMGLTLGIVLCSTRLVGRLPDN